MLEQRKINYITNICMNIELYYYKKMTNAVIIFKQIIKIYNFHIELNEKN